MFTFGTHVQQYTLSVTTFSGTQQSSKEVKPMAQCTTVRGFNPLDTMGICLNKQKLMYKVLAPSTITPMEALDTCMCPWLVKC